MTEKEKLEELFSRIKATYGNKRIAYAVYLERDFPEIKIESLRTKVRKVYNKSLVDFLIEKGIMLGDAEKFQPNVKSQSITDEKTGESRYYYLILSEEELIVWKKAELKEQTEKYLFAATKDALADEKNHVASDPGLSAQFMCEILKENGKSAQWLRAAEFCLEFKAAVSQETIDALYTAASEAKAKKAVELLSVHTALSGGKKSSKKVKNPIEIFCQENFSAYIFDKFLGKLKLKATAFKKVKYKDSDVPASDFVVKCAIVPYMRQLENNKPKAISNYKKECTQLKREPLSDKVAEALDMQSLRDMLDNLLGKGLPSIPEVIIPYGRYASEKQIAELKSRIRQWEKWEEYSSGGRKAIIIANGAITLNDTREALLIADKSGFLGQAARARGVSETFLRDTVLSEFDFDPDGKKRYDLGGTVLEVSLNKDLSVKLYDVHAEKEVKSVPKKGNDEKKCEIAAAEIVDTKKNIKNVIKSRIAVLKNDFITGDAIQASEWKDCYLNNPVVRKVGELVVWSAKKTQADPYEFTFMLKEDGSFIDSEEVAVEVDDSLMVGVANPVDMACDDIEKWKKYLSTRAIAQPFTQIFEPVFRGDIKSVKDMYRGIKLPFFVIKKLEKEGFEISGSITSGYDVRCGRDLWLSLVFNLPHAYSAKMIPFDAEIGLGELHFFATISQKKLNHAIYLLDVLCFESLIRKNEIGQASEMQHRLTEKNILYMIDVAKESGSTDCLAWLLNCKNELFPNAFDDLQL